MFKTIHTWLRVFAMAVRRFLKDDCLTLSSSISYVFILSIIPFSTLGLFMLSLLQRAFSDSTITATFAHQFAEELTHLIPFITKEWVLSNLLFPKAFASFTVINFLLLPIVSGFMFKILERSYRRVFRLSPRHLLLSQAMYAVLSIFTLVLLFVMNFTWNVLSPVGARVMEQVGKTTYLQQFYAIIQSSFPHDAPALRGKMLSILVLILFFLATVKIFLNVGVALRYRVVSAILFCCLWMAARGVFGLYIRHISRVNVVYGSLSSIVLILMWIFYSSVALLYSVEFMQVLHSGRAHAVRPTQRIPRKHHTTIVLPDD